ncbi:MAG: DUF6090 family protein [Xanthomonadales bacterium]|nr:DUF6090 family protein [Xanthomonadales bacterium]
MNREFRKYFGYAGGEILLVIAGIIIALQIDTWYENKQTQARLNDYLVNLQRDINDDIRRLEQLKLERETAIFGASLTVLATGDPEAGNTDWYDAALTAFASAALETAQRRLSFIANSGTYRALSSSGLISEMADAELESMLYDYYRTVERIASVEQDMNNSIRELSLRFETEVGEGLSPYARREPLFLWNESSGSSEAELETGRARYWALLTDPISHSLLRNQLNQPLLQEYEHLLSLGRRLLFRLDSQDKSTAAPEAVYSAESPIGHPVIIEAGRPGYHSYGLFDAPADDFDHFATVHTHLKIEDDALHVLYPGGDPWAYLYLLRSPIGAVVERFTKDYSVYDRIRLELKRDPATECPSLHLEIKDVEDAEKGGLKSVKLDLTPDWATYTFELTEFPDADLTRLNVVAGFLLASEPCSFSIRDVRYLRPLEEAS